MVTEQLKALLEVVNMNKIDLMVYELSFIFLGLLA